MTSPKLLPYARLCVEDTFPAAQVVQVSTAAWLYNYLIVYFDYYASTQVFNLFSELIKVNIFKLFFYNYKKLFFVNTININ